MEDRAFQKDVKALHKSGTENDYSFDILKAVIKVNDGAKKSFSTTNRIVFQQ